MPVVLLCFVVLFLASSTSSAQVGTASTATTTRTGTVTGPPLRRLDVHITSTATTTRTATAARPRTARVTASTSTVVHTRRRMHSRPRDARITAYRLAVLRSAIGWTSDRSGALVDGALALHNFLTIGITDRFEIALPVLLAYRFGDRNGHQVVPWGGITNMGFGFNSNGFLFEMTLDFGVTGLIRTGDTHQVLVEIAAHSTGRWQEEGRDEPLDTWRGVARVGYTITLVDLVTLTAGASAGYAVVEEARLTDLSTGQVPHFRWTAGAIAFCGRPVPLVQVHLSDLWSLDGYVTLGGELTGPVDHRYMLGTTLTW